MPRPSRTHVAVVLPVAAVLVAAAGGTAFAVAQARATAAQSVAAGTFGAQASTSAGTSSQAGPLSMQYVDNNDKTARLFFVRNTGTLPLVGQTWNVTVTNTAAGTKGSATVHACSGTYTSLDVCSGTETLIGTTSEVSPAINRSTSFAVPVGGALSAKFTPVGARGFTATVEMTVTRSQARTATVSAS